MRVALLLILIACADAAAGAPFERLVMPGELIRGHAKLEEDCEKCHTKFDKGGQARRCRECHKEVNADMTAKTGFHGRNAQAARQECKVCHTEHQGREADIVRLDRDSFDHALTDYPLAGAHVQVKCEGCHPSGEKMRKAPLLCVGCHKNHDRHQGRLGEKCGDCHKVESWRTSGFRHDKTRFPLLGKHVDAPCAACHGAERFKDTPRACIACHRLDDVHTARYGENCADCHHPREWKKPAFDHGKTKFALRESHRTVACDACHTGDLFKQELPMECHGCHEKSDSHRGKNGTKCADCHNERQWTKATFDHTKKTKFPLRGAHEKLGCETCHRGNVQKAKLPRECDGCHKHDDPHAGKLGHLCEQCHHQAAWSDKVRFDHDLARFPLVGLHATAPCEECHVTAAYKGTPVQCIACHKDDDNHKARMGDACAGCHNPNAWAVWKFNHDKQTKFRLTGKHTDLACVACHVDAGKRIPALDARCAGCHRKDDIHLGRFGHQCERCHSTDNFRDIELRH